MTRDVLVIGGGPAGSSAALALARRGWSVALVEKAAFPRRKVCGEYISAGTWPVLSELGVADSLAPLAGPAVRRVGLYARDTLLEVAMPEPAAGERWGRAIGREALDAVLLEHAARAGVEVLQPWTVEAVHPQNGMHVATARGAAGERTLRAHVVVAAHGSWEHAGLPTQPERAARAGGDMLGFKAHFSGARLPEGLMPLVLFPGGYGGLVHTGAGRVSFSCCIRRDALARVRSRYRGMGAGDAVFAHVAAVARGVREALGPAWRVGPWLAAGPIRPGIRARSHAGVFPVGNAAGEAHPLVAEGIGMAIQSAWLLGRALGAPGEEALDARRLERAAREYDHQWRSHFASRVRASTLFAFATSRALDTSAALLARAPAVLAWGARRSGKSASVVPD
jgi:flavin-dependent dehydrogenase